MSVQVAYNPNDIEENLEGVARITAHLDAMLDHKVVVTKQMTDFFSEPGVVPVLMRYITRVEEQHEEDHDPISDIVGLLDFDRPATPCVELMRGYRLTEFLSQKRVHTEAFCNVHLGELVDCLFHIFDGPALGSFYHFNKVIVSLLQRHPAKLAAIITSNHGLYRMLPYLHCAPVGSAFIQLVGHPYDEETRADVFDYVQQERLLERVLDHVLAPSSPGERSLAASNVFARILDRLAALPFAERIVGPLLGMPDDSFLSRLGSTFRNADRKHSAAQRLAAANMLHSLMAKTEEVLMQSGGMAFGLRPIPNSFSCLTEPLYQRSSRFIGDICQALLNSNNMLRTPRDREPPNTAPRDLFTSYRLKLVEILCDLVRVGGIPNYSLVPSGAWKSLCRWFVAHGHNNIYHHYFTQMIWQFFTTANLNDARCVPVVKSIVSNSQIVTQLCRCAAETTPNSGDSGPLGFINVILNTLRLAAQKFPGSYLETYLEGHQEYQKALPLVMEQSKIWISAGSLKTVRQMVSPFGYSQQADPPMDFDPLGYDLGSHYAWYLGFAQPPLTLEQVEASRASAAKIANEAGALGNSAKRRKKKKKKKKKKNTQSASDATPSSPVQ